MTKIVQWNGENGYGFADLDSGERVFVPASSVTDAEGQSLAHGQDLSEATLEVMSLRDAPEEGKLRIVDAAQLVGIEESDPAPAEADSTDL